MKSIRGIKSKIMQWVNQSKDPKKLSLSFFFGVLFGLIPILGVNTFVCLFLAMGYKLNVLLVQAINYIMFPFQILMILPFIITGQYVFGYYDNVSAGQLVNIVMAGRWGDSLGYLLQIHLVALLGWVVIMLPISAVLYFVLLNYLKAKFSNEKSTEIVDFSPKLYRNIIILNRKYQFNN